MNSIFMKPKQFSRSQRTCLAAFQGLCLAGLTGLGASLDPAVKGWWPKEPVPFYSSSWGIHVQSASISGHYAHLTDRQGGLQIIDASNPNQPRRVSRYLPTDDNGPVVHIVAAAVLGDYAYLSVDNTELQVVDVSDPAHPRLVNALPQADAAYQLFLANGYAYAAGSGNLVIYDISEPTSPRRAGSYSSSFYSLALSGEYAYLGSGNGLEIVDVSLPALPRKVADLELGATPAAISVSGRHAFVALVANDRARFQIIDVTDPTRPSLAGSFELKVEESATAVSLVGSRAFFAFSQTGNEMKSGLLVIELSDPARPRTVGSYYPGLPIQSIAVAGTSCYLESARLGWDAMWLGGFLEIIDVSDPARPRQRGKLIEEGLALGQDIALSGHYAYMADMIGGLRVMDVSNPASPVSVSRVDVGRAAHRVAVSGSLACVLDRGWWYVDDVKDPGLRVVDVGDPQDPMVVGRLPLETPPQDIALIGQHALIVDGSQLRIIDISDPSNPRTVVATNNAATTLAVAGTFAYLAGENLQIFDISRPADPVPVGLPVFYFYGATSIAITGRHACVVNADGDFYVIDISNPAKPQLLGELPGRGSWEYYSVAVDGAFACISGPSDVRLIDISDPTRTEVVGRSPIPWTAKVASTQGLALAEGRIYVGTDNPERGLTILEIPPFFKPLARNATDLKLEWQGWGRIKLQRTDKLLSPDWEDLDVPASMNSLSFPVEGPQQFFRLLPL